MVEKTEGMLSPYRALDLANETGYLCGKLLGDLGADVIKIERPGGDQGRNLGPFYHDEADPEKSLFWFAYNNNKRGITLDIETADGREIFKKLVKGADWVIETFPPGYLDRLGLGYKELEKLNPGVILVSITPFGQSGPWRDYKAPDIVSWALGGTMYTWGDPDRPPVHISYHSHAELHAGAEAAVGALMALYYRVKHGEGQWVNVSLLTAAVRSNHQVVDSWDMTKTNKQRPEFIPGAAPARLTEAWPCKDGFVKAVLGTGQGQFFGPAFVKWMDSEGMANDFLRGLDHASFNARTATQDVVDRIEEPVAKFFLKHTKLELYEWSTKNDQQIYPVTTTKDIAEDAQLAARNFWVKLEHPELGTSITYPGPFTQPSGVPLAMMRCAPLIGEHNQEIYEQELGITSAELVILKQAKII